MEIKELRIKTGLSRKAFCEEFKIPVRTVEDWEAGRRNPPEYVKSLLAMAVEKYLNGKGNVIMKKYYMYTLKGESDLQSICNEEFQTPEEAAQQATEKGLTTEEAEICEIEEDEDGEVIVTDIIPLEEALHG